MNSPSLEFYIFSHTAGELDLLFLHLGGKEVAKWGWVRNKQRTRVIAHGIP